VDTRKQQKILPRVSRKTIATSLEIQKRSLLGSSRRNRCFNQQARRMKEVNLNRLELRIN